MGRRNYYQNMEETTEEVVNETPVVEETPAVETVVNEEPVKVEEKKEEPVVQKAVVEEKKVEAPAPASVSAPVKKGITEIKAKGTATL